MFCVYCIINLFIFFGSISSTLLTIAGNPSMLDHPMPATRWRLPHQPTTSIPFQLLPTTIPPPYSKPARALTMSIIPSSNSKQHPFQPFYNPTIKHPCRAHFQTQFNQSSIPNLQRHRPTTQSVPKSIPLLCR